MIKLVHSEIQLQHVDIIVNAANKELLWEDETVNGMIHIHGGPELTKECKEWVKKYGEVRTAGLGITKGHNLPCNFVIHTVGPVYPCNELAPIQLEGTYINSLAYASNVSLVRINGERPKSIAFPAISTGAFRFPFEQATQIQISSLLRHKDKFDEIRLVYHTYEQFQKATDIYLELTQDDYKR